MPAKAPLLLGQHFSAIAAPAVNLKGMRSLTNGKALVPILFITIACGTCSGFHGIVGSGTTSKQLACESDARLVGYGGIGRERTRAGAPGP